MNVTNGSLFQLRQFAGWKNNELGNLLWICFSCVGVVSNPIVVITITQGPKDVKTKCMKMLANLAMCDFCTCVAFLCSAAWQIYHLANYENVYETSLDCWFRDMFWPIFLTHSNRIFSLVISFDRLFAVTVPIRYRHWGNTYLMCMIAGPWFFCFTSSMILTHFTSSVKAVIVCAFHTAVVTMKGVTNTWSSIALVVVVWTMVMYGLIWLVVLRKLFVARGKPGSDLTELKDQLEFKAMRTVTVVIGVHFLCNVLTTGAINYARINAARVNVTVVINAAKSLWVFNSATNLFIYIATNSSFRDAFLKVFIKRKVMDKTTGVTLVNRL